MIKNMRHEKRLNPRTIGETCWQEISQAIDGRDFPTVMGGIEVGYRQALPVVITTRDAHNIIAVAVDSRQKQVLMRVEELQRMHRRAIIVHIDRDERNRRRPGLHKIYHCVLYRP